MEAAVPLLPGRIRRGNSRIAVHALPRLEQAASLIYTGGYENLSAAYGELLNWAQAGGKHKGARFP